MITGLKVKRKIMVNILSNELDKFDTLRSGSQYSILNNEYVPPQVSMQISRMKNERHSHYINNYTIC